MMKKMICIHIGARAHYLLPKSLMEKESLTRLITDSWVPSATVRNILSNFPFRLVKSFSNRYSNNIPDELVKSFTLRFLLVEVYLKVVHKGGWEHIVARNDLFQKIAKRYFVKESDENIVFGISYTSLEIFKVAKERKQRTILFQIDPGIKEEEIVSSLVKENSATFPSTWKKAPVTYWNNWLEECVLSDIIMVNSAWSKQALIEKGIDEFKIKILALPFPIEAKHLDFNKEYPIQFSKERPLRCLFLGTLTLRKGIHIIINTAAKLINYPIEFILVGHNEIDKRLLNASNIKYHGVATRGDTDYFYQNSDLFLFPTFSDGYGLTQLEAMAWKLPVVATSYCGKVVEDGFNGISLKSCTVDELAILLINLSERPGYIKDLSSNCLQTVLDNFTIKTFSEGLQALI